ncbi:type IV secretory system conjugative DNA transfer family protein [Winogradskyella litorisediminis]|uniref:Type IV secretory system conjugative DNA transfer family protein n=1 Tax=Winogradskyella litorisediminis TaxID=1156618 RepID=A0ABW3NB42_9FLAO
MTASEQVTLHFYQWDYRYRGYYLNDIPVDIEPPYKPFFQGLEKATPFVDDGVAPSLFKQITNLIAPPPKKKDVAVEEEVLVPYTLDVNDAPELVGFSFRFPFNEEIKAVQNEAFLNMLSYSNYPLVFEIVGTGEYITFQFVCDRSDEKRLQSQIKAYFPSVIYTAIDIDTFCFDRNRNIAICDFAVNDEFVRPIATSDNFNIDPLTSIIATFDSLQNDEVAVFQMLFKGISSPLTSDIPYSVSDGRGGSFFEGSPEMLLCAKDKIANSLFSVVLRIASQGRNDRQSQSIATELARNISQVSSSGFNKLIPLSNEGYSYDFHEYNLHKRLSNRLGFILNAKELSTFCHYPNKTVVSQKLQSNQGKTKDAPSSVRNQKYLFGINSHNGIETEVMLNDEMRLRHTHIIGATGVGKSTLIANMLIKDMKQGNGCALFDPHGDIVEDVLARVPENRKDDVILIDPSDSEFAIGFNLLGATTDAEKIVLSSDLVSSFKRHATAWGDNMSAVLSNAINTFLESSRDGTLIELKRFLLEDSFRNEFLTSVEDPSIHYYWNNEYAMVRKGIAPLLTRIDTFLRPKIVRYMLAQTKGVDFRACIEEKKIVLIKLSQGLIGEENSFLLGSMFLSKFNQVAQGRQSLAKQERYPYYIYLDEFQNFITPSITRILSGARKYGLGLVLAHQELAQIDDTKTLNSVISNPYIRICFRLGDVDAKRLESGFSYFEQDNLQSLGIGQAIMRVGSSANDFNIQTFPLETNRGQSDELRNHIVDSTRTRYATSKNKLDELLVSLLPKQTQFKKAEKKAKVVELIKDEPSTKKTEKSIDAQIEEISSITKPVSEQKKEQYLKQAQEQEELRKHRSLQNYIKRVAEQRGYRVHIEEELPNGKRVDVGLFKNDVRIAIEVSVSNSNSYEAQNIKKCIDHDYQIVYLVSESEVHLKNIKKEVAKILELKHRKKVFYLKPDELISYLDIPREENETAPPKRVKGWRVDVNYHPDDAKNMASSSISQKLKNLLKKKK